jgi:putative membrane-bound dehydrogenase-like protein
MSPYFTHAPLTQFRRGLAVVCSATSLTLAAEPEAQVLEGESLRILKHTGRAERQDLKSFGEGMWSGNAHLWWTQAKPGDVLEVAVNAPVDGIYRIGAGMTKAVDYGIFDISLDDRKIAGPVDFFNRGVIHTGALALGDPVKLAAGEHRLSFTVTGANDAAIKAYMLGLDYVILAPGEKADLAALAPTLKVAKPAAPGVKEGNILDAKPKTATEQLATFSLPEGFTMELVASEETGLPKPVMTAFDDAGRMWSVTATEYPRDQDPDVWGKPGKDRVVVFDAPLGPGPHTPRSFADGMVMPLSVLPYGRGAYVAQGPEILYLDDRDGDGKADDRKVLVKGFGVQDTHTLPHQLTQMPGGRIVYSQGVLNQGKMTDASGKAFEFNKTLIASMKPDGTDTRIIGAGLNNIWAWAHSRTGHVFFHEANDLGYSMVPFEEDTTYPSFIETKLHPASPFHPPTAQGLDLGGTGFSGLAICDSKSGSYPAPWQGLFYVANPILGKIHAVSGTLSAKGVWTFEKAGDLVTCEDPMFRPIAITFGPDGCLYITDWYNRIISHNEIARDHPARDKERGRVWRVRHRSQPAPPVLDMTRVPTADLPAHLTAENTWEMRAAWHQIGQRQVMETIPALVALLKDENAAIDARIHALWSLEDLGRFDASLWPQLLASPSIDLRRESVRALSSLQVPEKSAFLLLQPLGQETSWTVRYEILRYFRRAAGPVVPEHIAWLKKGCENPAPQDKVAGWNGTYLALGGSYERAFQDFLLMLAETKSGAALAAESKWDKPIATDPPPTPEQTAQIAERLAAVKAALPMAKAADGRPLVETICLTCHSIHGKGIGFAPPLDGSANRDLEGLLTAIVAPNAAAENVFRLYQVEKKDGTIVEGFKRNEDVNELTILLMGGVPVKVPIAEINAAGYIQGRSMMPDLTGGMTEDQVAAIVAFLRTVK